MILPPPFLYFRQHQAAPVISSQVNNFVETQVRHEALQTGVLFTVAASTRALDPAAGA
jgi:hypothetical protein